MKISLTLIIFLILPVIVQLFTVKRVFAQKAPIRLLMEKGIFTKEEFLEMVRVVDRRIMKKREGAYILLFQRDKNTEGVYEKRST